MSWCVKTIQSVDMIYIAAHNSFSVRIFKWLKFSQSHINRRYSVVRWKNYSALHISRRQTTEHNKSVSHFIYIQMHVYIVSNIVSYRIVSWVVATAVTFCFRIWKMFCNLHGSQNQFEYVNWLYNLQSIFHMWAQRPSNVLYMHFLDIVVISQSLRQIDYCVGWLLLVRHSIVTHIVPRLI